MLEEHSTARIYDWAEIIPELLDFGGKWYRNQIADLVRAKNFELNGIQETLLYVSAGLRFVRETSKESVKRNGFRKTTCVHYKNHCDDGIRCLQIERSRVT